MKTVSNNRQLSINLVAGIVVFCVQFFISFWVSPFVVGKLGEAAYGFVTLANNFIQYASLFAVAINSMAGRYISIYYNSDQKDKANTVYSTVFWANAVLSVVVLVVASVLIDNIEAVVNVDASLVTDVKITFGLSFANLLVSFLSTAFMTAVFARNRMDLQSYTQILANLLKMGIIVLLFTLLAPHIYYIAIAALVYSLVVLLFHIAWRRALLPGFGLSPKKFSWCELKRVAKSGMWVLVSNLSNLMLSGFDLLIANWFISQAAMGRLSIAQQIPTAVGTLLNFLSSAFSASFTKYVAEGDKQGLVAEVKKTCRILGFLLAPFIALIIVFAPSFFELWLPGDVYDSEALEQVYVLMMLVLSNTIVNAFMYNIHSVYIALDHVREYSIAIFASGVISIILTVALVLTTDYKIYAIAGVSTVVLALVNLLWVPLYAEKIIGADRFAFLKSIFPSYVCLFALIALYIVSSHFVSISDWPTFIANLLPLAIIGYAVAFFLVLPKEFRNRIFAILMKRS